MSKHRILVVDPVSNVRFDITRLLGNEGFDVLTAGNSDEALLRASALRPDVILVDLESRDDLARISLLASVATDTEIITLVPHTALALEAMRRGAIRYTTKPLSRIELLAVIFGFAREAA